MNSSKNSSPRVSVVLIVGPEAALRDAALARLREQVLAGATPEFNEDRFDLAAGGGVKPENVLAAARTLPLMAEQRLVIVRGLGDRRAAKFIENQRAIAVTQLERLAVADD